MNCKKRWEGETHHSDQILVPHIFDSNIIHQPTDDRPRAFGFAQVDLLDVQPIRIGMLLDYRNLSAFALSLKIGRRKDKDVPWTICPTLRSIILGTGAPDPSASLAGAGVVAGLSFFPSTSLAAFFFLLSTASLTAPKAPEVDVDADADAGAGAGPSAVVEAFSFFFFCVTGALRSGFGAFSRSKATSAGRSAADGDERTLGWFWI